LANTPTRKDLCALLVLDVILEGQWGMGEIWGQPRLEHAMVCWDDAGDGNESDDRDI
jgi:hypothetical protein